MSLMNKLRTSISISFFLRSYGNRKEKDNERCYIIGSFEYTWYAEVATPKMKSLGKSFIETSLIAPPLKLSLAFSIREGGDKNERERCWFDPSLTNGGRVREEGGKDEMMSQLGLSMAN
jgi:hypothetical protein